MGSCSYAGFLFSFQSSLLSLRLSSGSSVGVRFGSSSFISSGALFWWVSCGWSGRPLCMLPVCLAGCSWLSGSWSVSYLIASDWRSRFRVLFVLLSPSLRLSRLFPDPVLSPLGAVPCWLRCLSLVPSTLMLRFVIFLVGFLFVSLRFLRGWPPVVALSRLHDGVQLFCFPVAPSQSVLPALSGALGGLPGSLLCLPPGYGSSCFHGSLWLV